MGQFLNFLRIFQAKSTVPRGRRDVIVGDVPSRLPAEQSEWRGTSRPSLAQIGQFPNFLRFFKAKSAVLSGRRDVIDDVTSRLAAERFRGGEEPPGQVWRGSDSSQIFYYFLKQNPRFYQVAVTSSTMTSHRAYPQNDSGVARNLQAKFGADQHSGWRAYPEHTHRQTNIRLYR
jgi:hypothetical protein